MKILLAIDLLYDTQEIVSQAKRIAQALSAEVWLLHITPPDPDFVGYGVGPQSERDFMAAELRKAHQQLQAIATEFRELDITTTALLVQGETIETIVAKASQLSADIVLMGSHGRGMVSYLFAGSTTQGVLRQTTRPVLVIPNRARDRGVDVRFQASI